MAINVAVLGYGFSAKVFHLPFITSHQAFRIHTIFERSSDSCLQEFPNVQIAKSLDQVLSDPEVDLVIVTTINATHYEFTKRSLEAGKHVIVEKPFTENSAQARELCDIAASRNLVLGVYHNRRFDGDFITAQKLIHDGVIGRPVFWESSFQRFQPSLSGNWREREGLGSGVLYDLGSHLIDQVVYALGSPQLLTAFLSNERQTSPESIEDSFMIILQYPKLGLQAVCRACCLDASTPLPRFTIRGTAGTYVKAGMDPQEAQLMATPPQNPLSHPDTFGREDMELFGTCSIQHQSVKIPTIRGNWLAFYENVAEAIQRQDRTLLIVKPEEAERVVKLLELCRISAKEGRTVAVEF